MILYHVCFYKCSFIISDNVYIYTTSRRLQMSCNNFCHLGFNSISTQYIYYCITVNAFLLAHGWSNRYYNYIPVTLILCNRYRYIYCIASVLKKIMLDCAFIFNNYIYKCNIVQFYGNLLRIIT